MLRLPFGRSMATSQTPDATGAFLVQRVNVRQPPFTFNALFDYPILGIGTADTPIKKNCTSDAAANATPVMTKRSAVRS